MQSDLRIRELRFGRPKTRKTSAVVETYPTPMIVFNFEMDGLSVVKARQVKFINSTEYRELLKKKTEELPDVVALDYIYAANKRIGVTHGITYEASTFERFANDANLLLDSCPFKTVVLDSLTGVNEAAIGLVGAKNPKALVDARHWAGQAGAKIREVVSCLFAINCQCVVIIAHEMVSENETTKEVRVLPNIVSGQKETLGALASQFIYATTEMDNQGKPKFVIYTQPTGFVKGLGMRVGNVNKGTVGPTFQEIYGI